MINRIGDIQPLIQEYRSKVSTNANESDLTNKILDDYEQLLYLFKQKNSMVNQIWEMNEKEKFQLAQDTLDPLEQILYSSLLGIRMLDQEVQSESAKEYLTTLKQEIERRLYELKKASISVYPLCLHDLGAYGAIKSLYELLRKGDKLGLNIEFKGNLNRHPYKIELQAYRFMQYLIRIIDSLKTVGAVKITAIEKYREMILSFEGEGLVLQLQSNSEYILLQELVDSLDNGEIVEQNDDELHIVFKLAANNKKTPL